VTSTPDRPAATATGGVRSELIADPLALLRTRTSTKWASYPPEILPMFVAEMDYPVAPEIAARLVDLVGRSDLGYDSRRPDIGRAFAAFAADRWDWEFEADTLRWTTNVMVALTEVLRAGIRRGDRVATATPVYGPFYWAIAEAGGERVDVPLMQHEDGRWGLDLDGIAAAFAEGVRAFVLCNPHNPVGIPHTREDLARLAELAAEHDVLVISNEIHAALTHTDAVFTPYLAVSDAAREHGVTVTSASKAFNLAGLLCAFWIPGSPTAAARIAGMPESVVHRVSHLATHAATTAFTESRGWLDAAITAIQARRAQLAELLGEQLPDAVYHQPQASYLAWIDFRPLGWGDDPAKRIIERGQVALSPGRQFGPGGRGFARINIACSPEVLAEGVRRIALAR